MQIAQCHSHDSIFLFVIISRYPEYVTNINLNAIFAL